MLSLNLTLVLHHFTRKLCLQFLALKMRKLCEISFPNHNFLIDSAASHLVETYQQH